MVKLTITEESMEELKPYVQATNMKLMLWDISQEIFRPARKHGYSACLGPREHMNIEDWSEETHKVVGTLEEMFYELLSQREISLD